MTDKVDFTGVKWGSTEWTMLGTLYLRACESRLEHPVLGDRAAAEAVDRIDYDFDRMGRWTNSWSNQFLVALRAKQLDDWAGDFLERHPDAVVLHLGCGLDSRAFRLDLPSGVDWFDVDVPEVIELRREIFSEREHYRMIGSSVTEPGWLDDIPSDRPALVIAEGLFMYLTESDVRQLLQRLTDRFGSGELLFDALPRWTSTISGLVRWGTRNAWGTRDARELERWNPRLKYVSTGVMDVDAIPLKPQRLLFQLVYRIPAARNYDTLYRFRF
ncbi:class I SAM-dependent methyltransferase [Nocardia sp. NPDC019395]|uniref:class I SAM-dependent methyltransferase n=1 Tax=Nocardia sp. NPDC019395 TaxID=3154686 RepID=UPI0034080F15